MIYIKKDMIYIIYYICYICCINNIYIYLKYLHHITVPFWENYSLKKPLEPLSVFVSFPLGKFLSFKACRIPGHVSSKLLDHQLPNWAWVWQLWADQVNLMDWQMFGEATIFHVKIWCIIQLKQALKIGCLGYQVYNTMYLGGGFKDFFFHPDPWGRFPFLTYIGQIGWNHQLVLLGDNCCDSISFFLGWGRVCLD